MSPEQAGLGEVDHRADLFGLGCVLYEMVHGTPPFRGASELETLERVRQGRMAVPPEALAAPEPLKQVLARALAPVDRRYQSAAEMRADLAAYLASQPASVSREELGGWAVELSRLPEPEAASRVDDAVRRLLGGGEGEGAPRGTSVFASSPESRPLALRPGAGAASPAPRLGRLNLVLLAVAAVGICGWLLWGLRVFQPGEPARELGRDGAAPLAERSPAQPDQRVVLRRPGVPPFTISSSPSGANVLLDGELRGRTPLQMEPPRAPAVLELQKPGYLPWRTTLDPETATSKMVTLTPVVPGAPALLTVNSLPWSRVRLDGRFVGNTPLLKREVRAGAHRIELFAADGSLRKAVQVTLAGGEKRYLTFDFTR